jgi:hypothetical protein
LQQALRHFYFLMYNVLPLFIVCKGRLLKLRAPAGAAAQKPHASGTRAEKAALCGRRPDHAVEAIAAAFRSAVVTYGRFAEQHDIA